MKAACWLMDRLGVSEAVAGDLVEQFQEGRSLAWFWRQTFGAIVTGIVNDVRRHPFLVLRAVLVGLLLRQGSIVLLARAEPSFDAWVAGAALDLFNMSRPMYILVVSLANTMMAAPVWFCIGWLVARLHRSGHALVLVVTVWVLELPHYARLIEHAITDLTFRPYMTVQITTIALWMGCFALSVLGGSLANKEAPHEIA
jgi:hypothetical protein